MKQRGLCVIQTEQIDVFKGFLIYSCSACFTVISGTSLYVSVRSLKARRGFDGNYRPAICAAH